MRSFNRFLLAGTSHLAVLIMGAGAVWAASVTLGSESDGSTYNSPTTGITGTGGARGSNGDTANGGSGNGQNGDWSYGLLIEGAGITANITAGTIIGGDGGKGGDAVTGAFNGGHGGPSIGIVVKGDDADVTIGAPATVKGRIGGAGGAAGGTGGTAGSGSTANGITVMGERAKLTNNGVIETGTSGAAGSANGGTAGDSWGSDAVRIGLMMQGQDTYFGEYANFTNNGTVNGHGGSAVSVYSANATITNNAHGILSSYGGEEMETVYLHGGKATLINYGTIENINTDPDHAYAVLSVGGDEFGSEYSSTITNYGAIRGNVYIGPYDTFTNNGTVTGDIVLGVVANSDPLIYLNEGSTLNGNVVASSSNNGNVIIGSSGAGTANFTGNIGTNNTPIHNLVFANGATLALGGNSVIHTVAWSWTDGATIDLRTHKLHAYSYEDIDHNDSQTGEVYFKTTIDANQRKHGYFVFTQGSGTDGNMFSEGAPVIVPTVVGSVSTGSKYVIIQDTDGRTIETVSTVVNSGGYHWTVSSVT